MFFLLLAYKFFFMNAAIISIISMYLYGKTCHRSNSWANLMEEAQKDKFSKESLSGLFWIFNTSIASLVLFGIAAAIRFIYLDSSMIQNDPIVIAPVFALFNVFNIIKSISAKRNLK